MSGIEPLLQIFKQLENRGVPGRILTTDYLTFSEPEAFDKLNSLNNIKLKMYQTEMKKELKSVLLSMKQKWSNWKYVK